MITLTDKLKKRFEIQLKKIYVGHSGMKKDRPVLNQIHYSGDGHIEITNSMVGVRVSNVHEEEDSDENFPNMNRIFKLQDDSEQFQLQAEVAKELEDQLNVLYRNDVSEIIMKLNNEGIFIRPTKGHPTFVNSSIKKEFDTDKDFIFGINSRYLHDALMMIRLLGLKELTLHKNDSLRPINITSENLHYVVAQIKLPEREYT